MPYKDPIKHRECVRKAMKVYRLKHGASALLKDRLREYGLSLKNYIEMQLAQEGKCLICVRPFGVDSRLKDAEVIDHCHLTGKVRGLLCRSCNTGLGYFYDNIEYLQGAVEYLKASK